jgi:hypothetical protein
MTDSIIGYRAVSHQPKRRLIIPGFIVGGIAIAVGIWGVHHLPEPSSCEPGSRFVITQNVVSSTYADVEVCWTSPR